MGLRADIVRKGTRAPEPGSDQQMAKSAVTAMETSTAEQTSK